MSSPENPRNDNLNKTLLYKEEDNLPPLVKAAADMALEAGFANSCTPEQGKLLSLMAAGRDGGVIGETGTGYGVGLAWKATACSRKTAIISVEINGEQVDKTRALFADYPNVQILHGDWRLIEEHAPYDLLVLDGGGGGKRGGEAPPDPKKLLNRSGNVVLDDFYPAVETWPPVDDPNLSDRAISLNKARKYWFEHPEMLTTEFRLHPVASVLIGMRK